MDFFQHFLSDLLIFANENFLLSVFITSLIIFTYSVSSIPGIGFLIALSGYLYGSFIGYIISIISVTLGSFIFFLFSIFFLNYLFPKYYKKISNKIHNYISNSTFEYLIIFRMIPGPPLMLQNTILSLLNISSYKFIFSTIIGFTPITLVTVFIGNKLNDIKSLENLSLKGILTWDFLILLLFIILLLIARIKFKKTLIKK